MRIGIVCIGRTKEQYLQQGIMKYLRYLRQYGETTLQELKAEKVNDLKEAPAIRRKEAERIRKAVPEGAFLVALDERGDEMTSHEFAGFLSEARESGVRDMRFVVGGAMGLDESVTRNARKVLALSRCTLTHDMARLVLLEQLYRAQTIITGKTYHY